MGFMDKVGAGLEQAAHEVEKAFDKGKTRVGELQVEMQMDGVAKKLGYMVFDFYRGREVDQVARQKALDELSRLEDQLLRVRAEAAAKAETEAQARAARQQPPAGGYGTDQAPGGAPGQAAGQAPGQQAPDSGAFGGEIPGSQPLKWDDSPR